MWNREKLAALKEASAACRGTSFKVKLPGETVETEWDAGYARHTIEWLEAEFANHPDQPRQPYNEGHEGQ